jgi:hypothetical protein
MARIANYKIDNEIRSFNTFENYNGTIYASRIGNLYVITHWSTKVLEYDLKSNEIVYLLENHISQTTSTLVGRILRSLPRSAVMSFIGRLVGHKAQQRRLARMVGMY